MPVSTEFEGAFWQSFLVMCLLFTVFSAWSLGKSHSWKIQDAKPYTALRIWNWIVKKETEIRNWDPEIPAEDTQGPVAIFCCCHVGEAVVAALVEEWAWRQAHARAIPTGRLSWLLPCLGLLLEQVGHLLSPSPLWCILHVCHGSLTPPRCPCSFPHWLITRACVTVSGKQPSLMMYPGRPSHLVNFLSFLKINNKTHVSKAPLYYQMNPAVFLLNDVVYRNATHRPLPRYTYTAFQGTVLGGPLGLWLRSESLYVVTYSHDIWLGGEVGGQGSITGKGVQFQNGRTVLTGTKCGCHVRFAHLREVGGRPSMLESCFSCSCRAVSPPGAVWRSAAGGVSQSVKLYLLMVHPQWLFLTLHHVNSFIYKIFMLT